MLISIMFILCVASHIGKSLSLIIKHYGCYIQCLPALSPLCLPLMFKEDLILKKIYYNRDSINIWETQSHYNSTQSNHPEN